VVEAEPFGIEGGGLDSTKVISAIRVRAALSGLSMP